MPPRAVSRLSAPSPSKLAIAVVFPFVALATQWLLWDYFKPYVWFLFFPTAFFSAWIGGLFGGVGATVISALLVWYFFIPPAFSFVLKDLSAVYSVVVFVLMGGLFAWFHERLQHSMRQADKALASSKEANEKITQLYEKTLELDALKTQFFANVSHELRTPLTLILGPLERRLQKYGNDHPAAGERHETEMMLRNARLLYRHVTDLLDAAKLDAGRMLLAWSRLDISCLTRTMASHFESLATERHIDYRIAVPDELLAEVDGEKLQRVLLNLLSNAFKFTPDGGVVSVRLFRDGEQVSIEVEDNGPGVPIELREAVFERFRQVEGNASRRHGGTGLGLAIVKDFVELHGGSVALTEAPGGGALFAVRLPLSAPAGTALAEPVATDAVIGRQVLDELAAPAVNAGSAATVLGDSDLPLLLVVEDNLDMNDFIATALRPFYRVATAFDGCDGLAKALLLRPDLILTDLMMPGMSGDDMVKELRRQAATRDVPIVMLTARADEATRLNLLEAGVQEYLNKPFSIDELLVRVRGLVRARQQTMADLAASAERFSRLFHEAPVPMCFVNRDGVLVDFNRRFEQVFGYSHADVPTLDEWWQLAYPDPDYRDWVLETWQLAVARAAASGSDIEPIEYRVTCKNGNQRIVLVSGITLGEDFLATFFDLTERLLAEEAAHRQADEVLRRNAELERFNRASTGREIEMIKLKQQVNLLAAQLGQKAPYPLAFLDETGGTGGGAG